MSQVVVLDRSGNIRLQVEYFEEDRLIDIKQRLCRGDPESMYISHNGRLLNSTTPIKVLGERRIVLMLENDIEFTNIGDDRAHKPIVADDLIFNYRSNETAPEAQAKTHTRQAEKASDPRIFFINGKKYIVTHSRKRLNYKHLRDTLYQYVTKDMAMQLLLCAFLVLTRNFFLLLALGLFRLLSFCDYLVSSRKIWTYISAQFAKVVFMFIASMFFIEHRTYYDE